MLDKASKTPRRDWGPGSATHLSHDIACSVNMQGHILPNPCWTQHEMLPRLPPKAPRTQNQTHRRGYGSVIDGECGLAQGLEDCG